MRRRGRLGAAIALAAVTVLAGVGCSGTTTTTTSPTTAVESSSGTGTTAKATTTSEPATGTTRRSPTTTGKTSNTTDTTEAGSGTGSDPDRPFCAELKKADGAQKSSSSSSAGGLPTKAEIDEFLGYMEAARADAPDDAKDPLDTLINAYKDFEKAMSGPDPEGTAFEILANNTNMAAITALATVVNSTCGFALSGTGSGTGSGSGSGSGSGTGTASSDGFDCSSIGGFGDEPDEPTSIAAAKKALCATFGGETWFKLVVNRASWAVSGSDEPTWEIAVYQDEGDDVLDPDVALQVCSALSTYLDSVGVSGPEISIGTTHDGEGVTPKKVLVTRAASASASADHAGCVPA